MQIFGENPNFGVNTLTIAINFHSGGFTTTTFLRKIWKKPNDIACFFTFFKSNIIGPDLGQILPHQDHTQFDFICWFIRSNEICWRNPINFKNLIGIQ